MTNYSYALLDPRPKIGDKINDVIFQQGEVHGIEVTIPALANRCRSNVDPQHTGQNAQLAAIDEARSIELPPSGATLVTLRADCDSIGAMAVLTLRGEGKTLSTATVARIRKISQADRFVNSGYPGPRPLPTPDRPWSTGVSAASSDQELAAIAAAVADFRVSLSDRVEYMVSWLRDGIEPKGYRDEVERSRRQLAESIANGEVKVRKVGKVAFVESTHPASIDVGYCIAPVVVAKNPKFTFAGGPPHLKYTICAHSRDFADIPSALEKLASMEPGWGGSPTIGGSPQGVSSNLTDAQVVNVVSTFVRDTLQGTKPSEFGSLS